MRQRVKRTFYQLMFILFTPLVICQTSNEFIAKGDDYNKKFDLKNAAKYYEEAYKISPNSYYALLKITKIYNDLGEDYNENKDEDGAENAFNIALKYAKEFSSKFPDSAKVYTLLAMSYGNLALFEGGNSKLKLAYLIRDNAVKAIEKDSSDYLPYIILSIYNRQIASLNWFERAFANTFFGKVPDGSLKESERLMLKSLKIEPGIVTAMYQLSLTYKEMGNEKKEIEWLKKVLDAPITDFRDKYAKRKAKHRLSELNN
jgi:tetratricopeptide (TPR) repeat protein